ncbi:TRAP transporter substrate-binding protein DctP [Halobellus sp. H-GB7]|uniref:TRAP transporter substrate-binding protein n=2 Tax=Halobellus TaxID=1073986 RepID=UPI0027AE523B|nr:TRAP transporter substrate-binding protein DctP [Halobellus sp. H-GB7]MDQ2055969.1 TRAP transporter substrate-binding protein DctP [Halobellus sp. H-GB7]
MNRRTLLTRGAAIGTAGVVSGCLGTGSQSNAAQTGSTATSGSNSGTTGDSGGQSSLEFTVAGTPNKKINDWDSVAPFSMWELKRRLEERSSSLGVSVVGGGELCSESNCGAKVSSGIIPVGSNSMGNSTKFFPENDIWLLPYTFPSKVSLPYTMFTEESWERYWVPFAKKYGVVPIDIDHPPLHRHLYIGKGYDASKRLKTPSDIEGLKLRRTYSQIASTALDTWGGSPVTLPWGDTLQGMKSGVVDGMETFSSVVVAFKMAPVIDQVILNKWSASTALLYARVDWLKQLSTEQRSTLASVTKSVSEDVVKLSDEVANKRVGESSPPPEGSGFAENGVRVNTLTDAELEQWKQPVSAKENKDLYSRTIDKVSLWDEGFHNYLWDTARSSSVPEKPADFSIDAWWNDYIDEI